ncbi:site-specific DNA-methyltransferase, partial [Citrobacter freundii]|nr:site-specific DNA-methyltransferase [Citrobacter freundii]
MHYPAGNGAWRHPKKNVKIWLNAWGPEYEERDIGDGRGKALVVKGQQPGAIASSVSKKAYARLAKNNWPFLWFGRDGLGRPRVKTYLEQIKKGKVPVTYWSDTDLASEILTDIDLGSTSWDYSESGRSADGVAELTAVVGQGHGFSTVKPLKLMTKIIQLWCRPDGIVLDPFAGSGTTGHAVLELNKEADTNRRFILIEQGNTEKGDHYAKTLTAERVKRVISGDWSKTKKEPLVGGFRFIELKREKIDADAVNTLAREEMIDLLLTSYWDKAEKAKSYLRRLPTQPNRHLFAVNSKQEGFFLIWGAPDKPSALTKAAFREIAEESRQAGLAPHY